jgi:hypothetical protein
LAEIALYTTFCTNATGIGQQQHVDFGNDASIELDLNENLAAINQVNPDKIDIIPASSMLEIPECISQMQKITLSRTCIANKS